MNTKVFALVYGIVFLGAGIAGFIPGLVQPAPPTPDDTAPAMGNVGLLLGLFPVNAMHNIVHLIFGIWGLLAARAMRAAWIYAVAVGAIYLIFAIMGLAAGWQTLFGLVPLYGADVWLHLALAVVAIVFAVTGHGKWQEAPDVPPAS